MEQKDQNQLHKVNDCFAKYRRIGDNGYQSIFERILDIKQIDSTEDSKNQRIYRVEKIETYFDGENYTQSVEYVMLKDEELPTGDTVLDISLNGYDKLVNLLVENVEKFHNATQQVILGIDENSEDPF